MERGLPYLTETAVNGAQNLALIQQENVGSVTTSAVPPFDSMLYSGLMGVGAFILGRNTDRVAVVDTSFDCPPVCVRE